MAHGASTRPLHAKPTTSRSTGPLRRRLDVLPSERFARMLELGLLPPDTVLPPRNAEEGDDVVAWEDLPPEQQELFARYMAVYAAMVDNVDQQFGRLCDALEELGELDNTIFLFTSDNGASREGEAEGTTAYYSHLLGSVRHDRRPRAPRRDRRSDDDAPLPARMGHGLGDAVPPVQDQHARRRPLRPDAHGRPGRPGRRRPAPVGPRHGRAADAAGPARARAARAARRAPGRAWPGPASPARCGPGAPSQHREQLFEMSGHRGFYRDGWEVVTRHRPLTPDRRRRVGAVRPAADRTETTDLAPQHPERVAELAAAFDAAATANQVYPLDEGSGLKYLRRPPRTEVVDRPVVLRPGTPTLERWRSQRLIWWRSFTVDVDLVHARPATAACSSPTVTRAAATRCSSRTARWCWSSTTAAGG
jgi:arylsulfatase